ncbi:hypothetical protein, partial [Pseudomonas aeruginosa]|uniref:hypothetical protein n=1 Tax=Pseudomonas aeruginosa TaxID=287 RepID=UPI003EBAEB47
MSADKAAALLDLATVASFTVAPHNNKNKGDPNDFKSVTGRRQKLSATPDLSGTVLPLCLIPNSALKSAPPFKSV